MRKSLIVVLALAMVLAGCGGARLAMPTPAPGYSGTEGLKEAEVTDYRAQGGQEAPLPSPAEERMIIRQGTLSVVVQSTEESLAEIEALARSLGGYVSGAQVWKEGEQLHATVTIRVPAEDFDEARSRIKESALEVRDENISTQDVTEEYVDLESRLRNLELTEQELRELMTTVRERMEKAEDILAVYQQLTAIRDQIEQTKGRIQYLDDLVAMASLTVNLIPEEEAPQVVEPGWKPGDTVLEALNRLVKALQWFADVAIWLILLVLPVLIVILFFPALVAFLVWRWYKRRKKAA